jgi:hypothetical protein
LFEYLGTHPDLARIFDAAMSASHVHETAAMLEAYDFSGVHFLADIGGGTGSLISAVLQRYPSYVLNTFHFLRSRTSMSVPQVKSEADWNIKGSAPVWENQSVNSYLTKTPNL